MLIKVGLFLQSQTLKLLKLLMATIELLCDSMAMAVESVGMKYLAFFHLMGGLCEKGETILPPRALQIPSPILKLSPIPQKVKVKVKNNSAET